MEHLESVSVGLEEKVMVIQQALKDTEVSIHLNM